MVAMGSWRNRSMEGNIEEEIWNAKIDQRKAKSLGKYQGIDHIEFSIRK